MGHVMQAAAHLHCEHLPTWTVVAVSHSCAVRELQDQNDASGMFLQSPVNGHADAGKDMGLALEMGQEKVARLDECLHLLQL
jgi:hypothetical protein